MKALGIIQARMNSQRLPHKMLRKLGNREILYWVLIRSLNAKNIDKIIVATSSSPMDDAICEFCDNLGVTVYRGSEENVLERFLIAANKYKPEIVVRICADNPFVDPTQLDYLVEEFTKNNCDLVFNNVPKFTCNYADGFGAEAVSYHVLSSLRNIMVTKDQKEHVTKYFYDNRDSYSILGLRAGRELRFPNLSFDVNTEEDFKKLTRLVHSGVEIGSTAKKIIEIHNSLVVNSDE